MKKAGKFASPRFEKKQSLSKRVEIKLNILYDSYFFANRQPR